MLSNLPFFPVQGSTNAASVDALYLFFVAVTAFFSVLIAALVVFFAIRFRRRSPDEIGAPIAGVALVFKLDGAPRNLTTDSAGLARVDGVTATDGEAIITSVPALRTILEPRWTAPRTPNDPCARSTCRT